MDKKQWLESVEDNPNQLFVRSSLLADRGNVHWDDTTLENTLFAIRNNGIERLSAFYTDDLSKIPQIAKWYQAKDVTVETSYDVMVQILDAIGSSSLPSRLYMLKYTCKQDLEIPEELEHHRIISFAGNEKHLETGLKEIYGLKKKEIKRLIEDPNFVDYVCGQLCVFTKEKKLVGFVLIKNRTEHFVELSNLWVRRPLRGKGYSNEIIRKIVRLVKRDQKECLVTLKQNNYGMLKFFEDEKFELLQVRSRENLKLK
jgi:GNAT superfamily N-acetyltransferase